MNEWKVEVWKSVDDKVLSQLTVPVGNEQSNQHPFQILGQRQQTELK